MTHTHSYTLPLLGVHTSSCFLLFSLYRVFLIPNPFLLPFWFIFLSVPLTRSPQRLPYVFLLFIFYF
jgi:hypothetical protein